MWYVARAATDPLAALARKVPSHAGTHPSVGPALAEAIAQQHRDHPRWSYQLHYDNLVALAHQDLRLGPLPGTRRVPLHEGAGLVAHSQATPSRDARRRAVRAARTRSYEVTHVHGLWHLDFHDGSRPVSPPQPMAKAATPRRPRRPLPPLLPLAVVPRRDRRVPIHALSQAFQKRGLPRALLTDNGAAMIAAETVEGLEASVSCTHNAARIRLSKTESRNRSGDR